MKVNEANWDRIARVVIGVALIGVGLAVVGGTGGIVLAVVGLIPLVTGAVGTCPLYSVFGVSTCKNPNAA
ncbi:MAG: DUF2892 domain-containing protein [Acidimicrobiales bacterium]|nr:DUF2892 domain-containing protein [Acidimicrobiales bacterium]